jgi:hypothetical protein
MKKGGWRAGAGRPTDRKKTTDCRDIDVRHFQRVGALRDHWTGPWYWRDAETLDVTFQLQMWSWRDQVWLRFMWQGRQVEEAIRLERTDCFFGGTRPWFQCPGCKHRVANLYLHNGTFRCRGCHDLRYVCQSEDPINRTWRAQAKIEAQLGQYGRRPKGMHETTRKRLAENIARVERERRMLMHAGFLRLLGLG